MDIISLVISLISGAAGGNVAGNASQEANLGTLGNTIAGLVGGAGGAYILQLLNLFGGAAAATGVAATSHAVGAEGLSHINWGEILATIASSGVGGGALTFIAGLLKNYTK